MITGVSKQNAIATAKETAETQRSLDQKTLDNLSTAMHGEAFAYVKYSLYAEHARKSGNRNSRICSTRRPALSVLNTSLKKHNWLG